jgi:Tyrosine-protein kinase ephrin type A/B receptor-like
MGRQRLIVCVVLGWSAWSQAQVCDPGTFNTGGACQPCELGRFSNVQNATACSPCFAGRFANATGSTACSACAPGETSLSAAAQCDPCVAGRFAPSAGSSTCIECDFGTSASQGAAQCIACDPGRYADQRGSAACDTCSEGFFAGSAGASRCESCDAGRYAGVRGQTACDLCDAGRFSDQVGAAQCAYCPTGRFADARGTTACDSCSPGRFQSVEGQAQCLNCPAGRFSDQLAQADCRVCGPGRFQPSQGLTSCLDCPAGQIALDQGAVSCLACVRFLAASKVALQKVNTDATPGNEGLKLSTEFQLVAGSFATLDPATFGARIAVLGQGGAARPVDLTLPPGTRPDSRSSGWTVNAKGDKWSYVGRATPTSPLATKMVLQDRSGKLPGQVKVTVVAKNGAFPTVPADVPVEAVVIVGDATCGASGFSPEECLFSGSGKTLTCKER